MNFVTQVVSKSSTKRGDFMSINELIDALSQITAEDRDKDIVRVSDRYLDRYGFVAVSVKYDFLHNSKKESGAD